MLVLNRPCFSNPHPQMHRHSPQEQGKGSTSTSHLHSRPWAAVGKEASKLERGLWTQCTPSPPRLGLCSGLRTHLLTGSTQCPGYYVSLSTWSPFSRAGHWAGSGCPTLHMLNPLSSVSLSCFRVCVCLVAQSCLILCNPMDYSPSGSIVHGGSPGKNTGVGLLCLPPGDLPNPGIEPRSHTLQVDSLPSEPPGKALFRV